MAWLKSVVKGAANVATLGGSGKLDHALDRYKQGYAQYQREFESASRAEHDARASLAALGTAAENALLLLNSARNILSNDPQFRLTDSGGTTGAELTALPSGSRGLIRLQGAHHAAFGIATGAASGGSVALGSWTLVSYLGTASTGTAIGGLHGVAATNAILAWFGGGSLAAGGGGMAAGMAALSGLVLIPMVAVAAWYSHRKAKELDGEAIKIEKSTLDVQRKREQLVDIRQKAGEHRLALVAAASELGQQIAAAKRRLFPYGFVSVALRRLRLWLGGAYFTNSELPILERLDNSVLRTVSLFGV
jgi:formiminotetrahydrofolate cyclodeaminase